MRNGGIVGRGVLIDYHDWAARHGVHRPPFESVGIPLADLQAAAAEQGVAFRPGDVLFVRSGFGAAYHGLGADAQKALAARPSVDMIGVQRSEELLRWLWESRFAAVAGDAVGFEQSPPQARGPERDVCLHNVLLSGWGMPIGELFDLEELARVCKRLQRTSFFLSSVPLHARRNLRLSRVATADIVSRYRAAWLRHRTLWLFSSLSIRATSEGQRSVFTRASHVDCYCCNHNAAKPLGHSSLR